MFDVQNQFLCPLVRGVLWLRRTVLRESECADDWGGQGRGQATPTTRPTADRRTDRLTGRQIVSF